MKAMRGFSLLELLLSITLGLLSCALLLPVLQATLHSQRFALARLDAQQDARFVLQQLGRDMRMAGSFAVPVRPSGRPGRSLPCHCQIAEAWHCGMPMRGGCHARWRRAGQARSAPAASASAMGAGTSLDIEQLPPYRPAGAGEQAWLEKEGETVWLRLPPHHRCGKT
jgi:Tfp pilus assembly protein PilW